MATNGNSANGTGAERSKTGIKVIIVGAGKLRMTVPRPLIQKGLVNKIQGFGGLAAAIECHRNGHDVEIYEAFPELKVLGDIISFGPNAGRIFYRWNNGQVAKRMRALSIDLSSYGFNIHKYDTGEIVINQKNPGYSEESAAYNGHRGELHQVIFDYARDELGIPIHLNNRIEQYFEEDESSGIILESGERVSEAHQRPQINEGKKKEKMLMLDRNRRSLATLSSQQTACAQGRGRLCSVTKTSRRAVAMQSGAHGKHHHPF